MAKNIARVLLDRSGSMGNRWHEAIGGVNGFVEGLDNSVEVKVDVFDAGFQDWYLNIRSGKAGTFEKLTESTVTPRGMTALTDAVGKLLSDVLESKAEKAMIVIMTDGFENASREFRKEQVKTLIEKCEKKGYEIVWLGADFAAVEDQATGYGLKLDKVMNVSDNNLEGTYRGLSASTMSYFDKGESVMFDATAKSAAMASGKVKSGGVHQSI